MLKEIKEVYNWLEVGNPPKPSLDTIEEWSQSEALEFREALANNDTEEMADALSDEIIFILNKGYFYGVSPEQLYSRFQKVLKSNWTKYANNEKVAQKTVKHYSEGIHWNKPTVKIETNYHKSSNEDKDIYVIKEIKSGKILKALTFVDSQDIEL